MMLQSSAGQPPTEVLFYHLERQPLEKVLPGLLEKTLNRGWRAVVQSGNDDRLAALNQLLWTYSDDSFLAHGSATDGFAAHQPVWLTTAGDTPNGAKVRFFVDGAVTVDLSGLIRAIFLFDGNDASATAQARVQWKAVKAANLSCAYWQQTPEGRWQQKA